jgi:predicted outer membrane repeat protein
LLEALEDRWLPSQISLPVTSLADPGPGSLRAAILTADAGSHSDKFTIDFAVTGTIDLQSPLPDLNNSIVIQGPGANNLTIERAASASFTSAIITVDRGQTASLSGLTVANGDAGGIFNYGGTLAVSGCTLSGNSGAGGIVNEGALTVSGCTMSGDSADLGGGIANLSGTATVANSHFCGNSATEGGGIYNTASLLVNGSNLSGNSASVRGGGICNDAELTVSNSSLLVNSASYQGGGIFNSSAGGLTLGSSTLCGNSATYGGGIFNIADAFFGPVTVRDSTFTGNSATEGGGIYTGAVTRLDVRGCTFTASNSASDSGGGIYNLGTATLQDCTLSDNTAGSAGGGIFNGTSGTLTIDDSDVCGDLALLGADLYNLGKATLNDSSVCVIGP